MGDSSYYITSSIEASDKAARAFQEFWTAFASIHDNWPFSVIFDTGEFNEHKHELAQVGNYIDAILARLLLEKHREGNRTSS